MTGPADGALGLAVVGAAAVLGVGLVLGLARLVRVGAALLAPAHTGGLPPIEHAVSRFHVRWYTVGLVLLAVDMEMIFMYPWTLVVATRGASSVIEMFGFLAVLGVGVAYAWRQGAFRWT